MVKIILLIGVVSVVGNLIQRLFYVSQRNIFKNKISALIKSNDQLLAEKTTLREQRNELLKLNEVLKNEVKKYVRERDPKTGQFLKKQPKNEGSHESNS